MQELRRTYKPRRKLISGYYCTRAVNESSDPREQISRPSKEGQIKVHKGCIKALKRELNELTKLMDSGTVVGSRNTYCRKCRVGLDEYSANGKNVANLDSKELTSN